MIIKPRKGWQLIDFHELWRYRDLLYFLVVKEIKLRYKQTILGGLWAIIQPFFMMIVFTLFFGNLADVPSDGVPYPIFNYSAMVAWMYFANATTISANSLIMDVSLVSKVYCPRMTIPLAPVLAFLLDFFVAFVILVAMMLWYSIYPGATIALLPVLVMLMVLTAAGIGLVLSALNANYRDIRYTVTFLIQFWMFASPVAYPTSMIPEEYHLIYAINPMAGVIEGLRSVLLGSSAFPTEMVLVSTASSATIFLIGAFYFRRTERYLADVI
ncbi:MAG: ABC transporter permease [Chloroflexi bacterium]|nr:ABC transporter permease [Chloroflexota bacterium]